MEEDVNSVKILNLQSQMDDLKESNKLINNNMNLIITTNSNNQLRFDNIGESLKGISASQVKIMESLDANSIATRETENTVNILKKTTDELRIDVNSANEQIKTIQEAPLTNYNALKRTVYACLISAVIGGLAIHFFPMILLAIFK